MSATTIRYELLTTAGLRAVTGEYVEIANTANAAFGLHKDRYHRDGPEKWVVTHLASGLQVSTGSSRVGAITAAINALSRAGHRLLEHLDRAIAERAEFERALYCLRLNEQSIFGRAAARPRDPTIGRNPMKPTHKLMPCPFCGAALDAQWNRPNPKARCITEGCKGGKLPVLNLDQVDDIAAWNARAVELTAGERSAIGAAARLCRDNDFDTTAAVLRALLARAGSAS